MIGFNWDNKKKQEQEQGQIQSLQEKLLKYVMLAGYTAEQFQAYISSTIQTMGNTAKISWLKDAIIKQIDALVPRTFSNRPDYVQEYSDKIAKVTFKDLDASLTARDNWFQNKLQQRMIPQTPVGPITPQITPNTQPQSTPNTQPSITPTTLPENTPITLPQPIPNNPINQPQINNKPFTPLVPVPPEPSKSDNIVVVDHIQGFNPETLPEETRIELQVQFALLNSTLISQTYIDITSNTYKEKMTNNQQPCAHIDSRKMDVLWTNHMLPWNNVYTMFAFIKLPWYAILDRNVWNMNLIYKHIVEALTKTWTYKDTSANGLINTQEDYWTFLVRGQILTSYNLLCRCLSDQYKYTPI